MDFEKLTKRVNRKLGLFDIVSVEDVKKMWIMASEVIESKEIKLYADAEKLFKKRWIQCRFMQMPEYWTDEVINKYSDLGYTILFSDLESIGKEEEENLMRKLDLFK